jgi:tetratricopeptide (TPR) repeat protein
MILLPEGQGGMDEGDSGHPDSGKRALGGAAPLAVDLARGGSAKAETYLDEQTKLTRLQIEDLKREDRLRHWSLRVRHVSDVLKLGFELAIAFIVAAIAVGLGVVIWQAAHADGLVIESFDVPTPMAQRGLTGSVIANKLLDRLTVMQNETNSTRPASSFAHDWTNDIKVEIPDTGVSLGQIVRFLDDWLGRQMHLSGELYETPSGVALTVRMDNDPGQTFEGSATDLNGVVAKAAETVYARAQPYRYGVFLSQQGRIGESVAAERRVAAAGPAAETAWADAGLAISMENRGDYQQARAYVAEGRKANPDLPNPDLILYAVAYWEGRDEESLAALRRGNDLLRGRGAREWSPDIIEPALENIESNLAELTGDYIQALVKYVNIGTGSDEAILSNDAVFDVAMHDGSAAERALVGLDDMHSEDATRDADTSRALWLMQQKEWRGAIALLQSTIVAARRDEMGSKGWWNADFHLRAEAMPQLAYAHAMLGEFDQADAVFRTLPEDCDICMRYRGKAEAARHNWSAATHWFALVSARSPDIPFADTDWGEMLLRKGDLDGAIAKFESANKKGPHFADPLEMWGEALIAKNRSELALAKFEEANNYAPNWGRLHLKWAEALLWTNRRDEAKAQFAAAGRLDLTPSEKSELAKVVHG